MDEDYQAIIDDLKSKISELEEKLSEAVDERERYYSALDSIRVEVRMALK